LGVVSFRRKKSSAALANLKEEKKLKRKGKEKRHKKN